MIPLGLILFMLTKAKITLSLMSFSKRLRSQKKWLVMLDFLKDPPNVELLYITV